MNIQTMNSIRLNDTPILRISAYIMYTGDLAKVHTFHTNMHVHDVCKMSTDIIILWVHQCSLGELWRKSVIGSVVCSKKYVNFYTGIEMPHDACALQMILTTEKYLKNVKLLAVTFVHKSIFSSYPQIWVVGTFTPNIHSTL